MATSKVYEMSFKLGAKLGDSFKDTFGGAEKLASSTFHKIAEMGGDLLGGVSLTDIFSTWEEFEQSLANAGATAGIKKGSEEYMKLEMVARDAGRVTTKTAAESADALKAMTQSGWTIDEAFDNLKPMIHYTEAFGGNMGEATSLISGSMAAMGVPVDQLATYLDIAANANNKTNQTANDLLETFAKSGGMFKLLNTSMEESAAITSTLANRNKRGAEAGTALNAVLINLMGNGRSSGKALQALGLDAYDANGNFKGITNVLKEIDGALEGLSEKDKGKFESLLGGKAHIETLHALLDGIHNLDENGVSEIERLTETFKNSEGALDAMAETMTSTLSGSMKLLGSAADELKLSIGKELAPAATQAVKMIADSLPTLADKAGKATRTMVDVMEFGWSIVSPIFSTTLEYTDAITAGVVGIGSAIATAKIASGVQKIGQSLGNLKSAVVAHPYLAAAVTKTL